MSKTLTSPPFRNCPSGAASGNPSGIFPIPSGTQRFHIFVFLFPPLGSAPKKQKDVKTSMFVGLARQEIRKNKEMRDWRD